MTLAKTLAFELQKMPHLAKNALIVSTASILLGLCAHISIPLPFTPVPLVLQNTLVLLLSVVLGPKRAFAAVAAFLAQGAIGLPVFAGGAAGLLIFAGPRGGYLIGYLAASLITAAIVEKCKTRSLTQTLYAMLAGLAITYACGAAWLAIILHSLPQALLLGVAPFLLGDALKIALSLKALHTLGWGKQ